MGVVPLVPLGYRLRDSLSNNRGPLSVSKAGFVLRGTAEPTMFRWHANAVGMHISRGSTTWFHMWLDRWNQRNILKHEGTR